MFEMGFYIKFPTNKRIKSCSLVGLTIYKFFNRHHKGVGQCQTQLQSCVLLHRLRFLIDNSKSILTLFWAKATTGNNKTKIKTLISNDLRFKGNYFEG